MGSSEVGPNGSVFQQSPSCAWTSHDIAGKEFLHRKVPRVSPVAVRGRMIDRSTCSFRGMIASEQRYSIGDRDRLRWRSDSDVVVLGSDRFGINLDATRASISDLSTMTSDAGAINHVCPKETMPPLDWNQIAAARRLPEVLVILYHSIAVHVSEPLAERLWHAHAKDGRTTSHHAQNVPATGAG